MFFDVYKKKKEGKETEIIGKFWGKNAKLYFSHRYYR